MINAGPRFSASCARSRSPASRLGRSTGLPTSSQVKVSRPRLTVRKGDPSSDGRSGTSRRNLTEMFWSRNYKACVKNDPYLHTQGSAFPSAAAGPLWRGDPQLLGPPFQAENLSEGGLMIPTQVLIQKRLTLAPLWSEISPIETKMEVIWTRVVRQGRGMRCAPASASVRTTWTRTLHDRRSSLPAYPPRVESRRFDCSEGNAIGRPTWPMTQKP